MWSHLANQEKANQPSQNYSVMNAKTKNFLQVVVGSTALACLLGICLDLVTANVAVEYFSVHHPRIVNTNNPWALAIVWGIAASWWCGAIAGIVIAIVNHLRKDPVPPKRILRWAAVASVLLWIIMISILLAILAFASTIPESMRRPTFDYDRRMIAVAMAHQYEYLLAALATIVIAILVWRRKPCESSNCG